METYVILFLVLHLVASVITSTTNTPLSGSRWFKAYKAIEVVALVTGKAKDGIHNIRDQVKSTKEAAGVLTDVIDDLKSLGKRD